MGVPNRFDAVAATQLAQWPERERFSAWARTTATLFLIFFVIYLSALARFTYSIDDETTALLDDATKWANQGRWVVWVIEAWVLHQPAVTFFPLAMFGLFASLSYPFFVRGYGLDVRDLRALLLFALFCAFPTIYFIANFTSNIIGLGVGYLAVGLLVAGFSRRLSNPQRTMRGSAVAMVPLVFAVAVASGSYQALLLASLVACTGLSLLRYVREQDDLRGFLLGNLMLAVVLVVGVALSEGINHLIRTLAQVDVAAPNARIFDERQFQLGLLASEPGKTISAMLAQLGAAYSGSPEIYGARYWTFPLLLLLGLAAMFAAMRKRTPLRAAIVIAYALAIALVPFALNLVLGGTVPYRILLGVPFVFWLAGMFALFSAVRVLRIAGFACVCLIALQSVHTFSLLQTARTLAYQHDVRLAGDLYDRIAQSVPDFSSTRSYPVDFYGLVPYTSRYAALKGGSTFAASFYHWDGGRPHRMINLMKVLGYENLQDIPDQRRAQNMQAFRAMPAWPSRDSIRFENGMVLVKLSNQPGAKHRVFVEKTTSASLRGPPLWTLSAVGQGYTVVNATVDRRADDALQIAAGKDVQLVFSTSQVSVLQNCRELVVSATIGAERPDTAQLFWANPATGKFDGQHSVNAKVGPGAKQAVFAASSQQGFADRLRLDPVSGSQSVAVSNLQVRCADDS